MSWWTMSRSAVCASVFLFAAGHVLAEEKGSTYGVEPLLAEIRTRQAELDAREDALEERERSLSELEAALDGKLAEISEIDAIIEERIAAWEEGGGVRVKKLAKIYAEMPSGRAARLLEGLDLALSTQILSKMKPKQSAAVMTEISRTRALTVSRQVAYPLRDTLGSSSKEDL